MSNLFRNLIEINDENMGKEHLGKDDIREELQTYIKEKNLTSLLTSILESLLIDKPDNPVGHIVRQLTVSQLQLLFRFLHLFASKIQYSLTRLILPCICLDLSEIVSGGNKTVYCEAQ